MTRWPTRGHGPTSTEHRAHFWHIEDVISGQFPGPLLRFPERRYEGVCTAEFVCSGTVTGARDAGGENSPSKEMSL
jgi:hypothetical protein